MASYNRVVLVGNVTRNIELRYTQGGTPVTDLGLAVNERVKRGDTWVDEPTYVEVTVWNRTAEVANEYLTKGSPVLIEGRLKMESWQDRETGQKRTRLKVICDRLQMLGRRDDNQPEPIEETGDTVIMASTHEVVGMTGSLEDVPF
ncbi:MAG: single-stranded DNA-binding protein [Pirellulaceae bacterium]